MKKISILISALLLSGGIPATGSEGSPDNNGNSSTSKSLQKLISIHRKNKGQKHPIKSRPIEGSIMIINGQLYMSLPLDNYPLEVEIAEASGIGGYWTATFMDPNSCSMFFDGVEGNYEVTITDSEDSVYIGSFSID